MYVMGYDLRYIYIYIYKIKKNEKAYFLYFGHVLSCKKNNLFKFNSINSNVHYLKLKVNLVKVN